MEILKTISCGKYFPWCLELKAPEVKRTHTPKHTKFLLNLTQHLTELYYYFISQLLETKYFLKQ